MLGTSQAASLPDLKSAVSASHEGIVSLVRGGGGHGGGFGGGHGGGGMGGGGPGFGGHMGGSGPGLTGHMGGGGQGFGSQMGGDGPGMAGHMGGGGQGFGGQMSGDGPGIAGHMGGGDPGFASPTMGGGHFAWHNVGEIGAINDHFDDNDHFKIVHNPNFDRRRFNNFVGGDTFIGGSVNNCWVWWPDDGWIWQCP